MPQNGRNFTPNAKKLLADMKKALKRAMSKSAAAIETNYKGSFRQQGFADTGGVWQRRHNNRDGGRATLTKSGDLRRSLQAKVTGEHSITLSTDVPYAQIHNEGGAVTGTRSIRAHTRNTRLGFVANVRAHTRTVNYTMPKRQFMPIQGEDIGQALKEKIIKIVTIELQKTAPQ